MKPGSRLILVASSIAFLSAVVLIVLITKRAFEVTDLAPNADVGSATEPAYPANNRLPSSLSRDASLRAIRDLNALVDLDSSGRLVSVYFHDPVGLSDMGFPPRDLVDSDLRLLAPFSELKQLDIAGTAITDAGLEHLRGLNQIEKLDLTSTAITGNGLGSLAGMDRLRSLRLADIPIDDVDLQILSRFSELRQLSVSSSLVSDSGLQHLHRLGKLESLYLGRLQVTDQGIRHLAKLASLTRLTLDSVSVGDESVRYFAEIPQLRYLHLRRTKISSKGAGEIQSALPSCTVNRDAAYP